MNFKKTVAIAAAAGALTALAVPAMAELNSYGSIRYGAFYQGVNANNDVGQTRRSDGDTFYDLALNSRVGVRGTTGAIGGVVELGLGSSHGNNISTSGGTSHQNSVYTRLAYGTYKFDVGTLLIGQDYSNFWVTSAQVDRNDKGFAGYGATDPSRQGQIKFTMNNGLYMAAIAATAAPSSAYRVLTPELNVGYKGKAGAFDYNGGAVFLTAETGNGLTANDHDIVAYMAYASGKFTTGPAAILYNISYGQNTGNMAIGSGHAGVTNTYTASRAAAPAVPAVPGNPGTAAVTALHGTNVATVEGFVQGSFKFSDMISANTGFGYVSDLKEHAMKHDDRFAFFVNAPITIAKGFSVTPELSYYDELKDASDKDQQQYYSVGAKLQMDF